MASIVAGSIANPQRAANRMARISRRWSSRTRAAGSREEVHDAIRAGVGGDVEVLGLDSQQQVAHAAAHQISLVACAAQLCNHRAGERLWLHDSSYVKPPAGEARRFASGRRIA